MPYLLACPTCHNSLSVTESPVDYVVHCPTCRHQLTVPAVAPPPGPAPLDFASEPERTRRRSPKPQNLKPLALVVAGVLLVVALLAGRHLLNQSERFRDTRDLQLALNRAFIANSEYVFWLRKGVPVDNLGELKREAEELSDISDRKSAALDVKWGRNRQRFTIIQADRSAEWEAFQAKCDKVPQVQLEGNAELMDLELAQLRARIAAEVQPQLILLGEVDRSTVAGDFDYQQKLRLLPIRREGARAACEVERIERYNKAAPAIVKKWVVKTRQQNRQLVEELEKPFLDR